MMSWLPMVSMDPSNLFSGGLDVLSEQSDTDTAKDSIAENCENEQCKDPLDNHTNHLDEKLTETVLPAVSISVSSPPRECPRRRVSSPPTLYQRFHSNPCTNADRNRIETTFPIDENQVHFSSLSLDKPRQTPSRGRGLLKKHQSNTSIDHESVCPSFPKRGDDMTFLLPPGGQLNRTRSASDGNVSKDYASLLRTTSSSWLRASSESNAEKKDLFAIKSPQVNHTNTTTKRVAQVGFFHILQVFRTSNFCTCML